MKNLDPVLLDNAAQLVEQEREMMQALKILRKEKGLSQAVVAERMGVTQPAVAAFESYDSNPTMASIRRYALAVGATITISVGEVSPDSHRGRPSARARTRRFIRDRASG